MKTCPDCAEQVQDAARVCRFCGHQFTPPADASRTRGRWGRRLLLASVGLLVAAGVVVGGLFLFGVLPVDDETGSSANGAGSQESARSEFIDECSREDITRGGFVIDCGCLADAVDATRPSVSTFDDYTDEVDRLLAEEPGKVVDCALE